MTTVFPARPHSLTYAIQETHSVYIYHKNQDIAKRSLMAFHLHADQHHVTQLLRCMDTIQSPIFIYKIQCSERN